MTSALLSDALAPLRADPARAAILLDIDGTLAPIVEHAADAHVPESTRQLLIEIARRYGVVACVSGRRASEARAMVAIGTISYLGSHGAEVLRAGWTEPVLDQEVEDWAERIHDFAREADTAELRRAARARSRTRARSSPSTGAAPPTRRPRGRRSTRSRPRPRRPGCAPTGGARCSRSARRCGSTRAPGSPRSCADTDVDVALYVGDDLTDLDAFHALAQLADEGGSRKAMRVGVRSDEGPSEITDEADVVVDGTGGVTGAARGAGRG